MAAVEKNAAIAPESDQKPPKTSMTDQEKNQTPDQAVDQDEYSPWNHGVEPMPLIKEILMVIVIISVQLFTQAALGAVLAPLHIIGDGLGISDPGELSWLIAGYSLTVSPA